MSMQFQDSCTYLAGNNEGGWKGKTRLEKKLIGLSVFLFVVVVALVVAVAIMAKNASSKGAEPTTVTTSPPTTVTETNGTEIPVMPTAQPVHYCTSEACNATAKLLQASLNESVSPCQDFYTFVCDGWIRSNPIPDDKNSIGTFEVIQDDILKLLNASVNNQTVSGSKPNPTPTDNSVFLYRSCMNTVLQNTDGMGPLLSLLLESLNVNEWPVRDNNNTEEQGPEELIAAALQALGVSPIISFDVDVDSNNTDAYIIILDQPSTFIGRDELANLTQDNRTIEIINAYKAYLNMSIALMGTILSNSTDDDEIIKEIIDFESQLAQWSAPAEERRDPIALYNKMTIKELSDRAPGFNWTRFINLAIANLTSPVNESDEVIVQDPGFIYNISSYIVQANMSRVVTNYILWTVVNTMAPFTDDLFRDAEFQFDQLYLGLMKQEATWYRCIKVVNSLLGYAVGKLYIENDVMVQKAKENLTLMVDHLQSTFNGMINETTWMDDTTKNRAVEKLMAMQKFVAYPDWILDDAIIGIHYQNMSNLDEAHYFNNMASLLQYFYANQTKLLREPVDRTDWTSAPAVVNAYYNPVFNSITFPAGILNPPFFEGRRPISMNFGAFGAVIGHEITHGFDDSGRQYNADGDLVDWWTAQTAQRFNEKAKCVEDEYGNLTEPVTGLQLNGLNTLGENIADNGGLQESYRAYQSYIKEYPDAENGRLPGLGQYTPDQLFFMSFASVWCSNDNKQALIQQVQYDPHSPGQFRANVPVSNFKAFATAFNCTADDPMVAKTPCVVW